MGVEYPKAAGFANPNLKTISKTGPSFTLLLIRGEKVILDRDLADLYGVETKRLNEQIRRNRNRIPADFLFRPTNK
jgi:hypothetical protein